MTRTSFLARRKKHGSASILGRFLRLTDFENVCEQTGRFGHQVMTAREGGKF